MKSIRVFKGVVASAFFVAGLAVADAQAQTAYQSQAVSASPTGETASRGKSGRDSQDDQPSLDVRGGYNVGRATVQNVPGCNGPISFCNLYFGS